MTSDELMAVARAEQDYTDGLSVDENPFPPGTREHKHYHDEFERLEIQELTQDLVA